MHRELAIAVLDVRADGMQRDTELAADPLVAGTGREQPHHIGLPRRKHCFLPCLWRALRPPDHAAGPPLAAPSPLAYRGLIAARNRGTVAAAAMGGVAWLMSDNAFPDALPPQQRLHW